MKGFIKPRHIGATLFVQRSRKGDYVLMNEYRDVIKTSLSRRKLLHQAIGFNLYIAHRERIGQQMANRGVVHLDM